MHFHFGKSGVPIVSRIIKCPVDFVAPSFGVIRPWTSHGLPRAQSLAQAIR